MDELAKRLRQARLERDLSQGDLAEEMGQSRAYSANISRWEIEERTPDLRSFYHLCKTLGVSADWLLGLPPRRERA